MTAYEPCLYCAPPPVFALCISVWLSSCLFSLFSISLFPYIMSKSAPYSLSLTFSSATLFASFPVSLVNTYFSHGFSSSNIIHSESSFSHFSLTFFSPVLDASFSVNLIHTYFSFSSPSPTLFYPDLGASSLHLPFPRFVHHVLAILVQIARDVATVVVPHAGMSWLPFPVLLCTHHCTIHHH